MRFIGIVMSLVALISLGGFVAARLSDIEGHLDTRSPELNALDALILNLKIAGEPQKPISCPATNNGDGKVYIEHRYTTNQLKAAFVAGAKLAADRKQLGDNKYPHDYRNFAKLPFPCGKDKLEFPIQTDNMVYNGGPISNEPDRVIFEYKKSKTEMAVKYCGVICHGPGKSFLNCRA